MAVASSTPVPTPNGWVQAGSLSVGDYVFAADGSPCKLTVAHHYKASKCYRLEMDDAISLVGDQHLAMELQNNKWRIRNCEYTHFKSTKKRKGFKRPLVKRTLEQLAEPDALLHKGKRSEYSLPNCGPVQYPAVDLPVPPYVMGIWFATKRPSGRHTGVGLDIEAIRKRMRGSGFYLAVRKHKNGRPVLQFRPSIKESFLFADALPPSDIPSQYMHAGVEQRQELLDGLIDGGFVVNHKNTNNFFGTFAAYGDARMLQELVESLGVKSTLSYKAIHRAYSLKFCHKSTNPLFFRRFLKKIEAVEPVECSHLLSDRPILVGEGFLAVC